MEVKGDIVTMRFVGDDDEAAAARIAMGLFVGANTKYDDDPEKQAILLALDKASRDAYEFSIHETMKCFDDEDEGNEGC